MSIVRVLLLNVAVCAGQATTAELPSEPVRINGELTIRAIAPDTYLVVDELPFEANSLVAKLPDKTLLLVGSPYDTAATKALIAWLRGRFAGHKLVAVNTHFHYDGGFGGNQAYLDAGATVYGSDLTAALVRERGARLRGVMLEALAREPTQRARFETFQPQPPGTEFPLSTGLALKFGEEEVRVLHPGPAHSPDNVVVWFPARQILFGGCAVVAMPRMGYVGDAALDEWPAALEVMRRLKPKLVVPGHQNPGDATLLDHTLELVRDAIGRRNTSSRPAR